MKNIGYKLIFVALILLVTMTLILIFKHAFKAPEWMEKTLLVAIGLLIVGGGLTLEGWAKKIISIFKKD